MRELSEGRQSLDSAPTSQPRLDHSHITRFTIVASRLSSFCPLLLAALNRIYLLEEQICEGFFSTPAVVLLPLRRVSVPVCALSRCCSEAEKRLTLLYTSDIHTRLHHSLSSTGTPVSQSAHILRGKPARPIATPSSWVNSSPPAIVLTAK